MYDRFIEQLRARVENTELHPLRWQGRRHFAPDFSFGRHSGPPQLDAKPAAVLILLEPTDQGWAIPLTMRPKTLPDHPGQISFPGGRVEARESHVGAARREFSEELGATFDGCFVGELFPMYVYHSNYIVRPFVGVSDRPYSYEPCSVEVAELIHLPVSTLLNRSRETIQPFRRGRLDWTSRVIQTDGEHSIWGATAMMLGELAALLGELDMPTIESRGLYGGT